MQAALGTARRAMGSNGRQPRRPQPIVEAKKEEGIDGRLGATLRDLRVARGWSLSYAGEICGISGAYVSKIERGLAKEYSLQLLSNLSEAYGMKLYELFAAVESIDVTHAALGPDERKLLDAYQSMSAVQKETVMDVAMTLRPPT